MTYGSPTSVAVALALLCALAIAAMTLGGLHQRRDAFGAALRALVQLSVVALVVAWVFTHPAGAAAYLGVMLLAATATSVRRIQAGRRVAPYVLLAIACGAAVAVTPVAITGALPLSVKALLPFAAQVVGGSMTAVSLAGGRMRDDVAVQWPVVEGWLVLGATPTQAVAAIGRRAAERSLVPALDQTRSAGLVVLPGAFVGMLLGGASPGQAAQVQLLVLVGLVAAESSAVIVITRLLGPVLGAQQPSVVH